MLWNEIRVPSRAIAGAFDLNDAGVVEESIEQRGRDDGVSEDLAHSAKPRLEVRILAPRS